MRTQFFSIVALSLLPAVAGAQTGYSITGGLSNFDCTNHCDEACDEFEIEIEDCRPGDITHTYTNGNYGAPVVMLSSSGTFTIIDYRLPHHLTAVNSVEHFGVGLRSLSATNVIRVKWMKNGAPATVNGQVPNNNGGGSTQATQPVMPTISTEMGVGSTGGDGVTFTVTNNDPAQAIWIKRRGQVYQGNVTLEQLMSNNAIVLQSEEFDPSPMFVPAYSSVSITSDLLEVEDNQSVIFAARYFQDVNGSGPFNQYHVVGAELGNVMTSALTSPDAGCDVNRPIFVEQPHDSNAAEGHSVDLRVNAEGNDGGTMYYEWLKEGQTITEGGNFHGTTTDELSIDALDAASEGFYAVRITNDCGTVLSDSAMVFITGHNIIRAPLGITADPATQDVNVGDTVYLSASGAFVPPGTTYQWKHNGVAIAEGEAGASIDGGFVTGAAGLGDVLPVTLSIDWFQATDAGDYTVTFTNAAGFATSNIARVGIAVPSCPADFDGDGTVDFFDYDSFVNCFEGWSCPDGKTADFDGDGSVDFFDYDAFVNAFEAPC